MDGCRDVWIDGLVDVFHLYGCSSSHSKCVWIFTTMNVMDLQVFLFEINFEILKIFYFNIFIKSIM